MPSDRELERELRELGSHVEYPPTPDLARAVRSRLGEGVEETPRRGWSGLPALRWVAVAAVVLIAAAPLLSPVLRDTATGWFAGGQASSGGQAAGGGQAFSSGSPAHEETMMMEDAGAGEDLAESGESDIPTSGGGARPLGKDLGYAKRIPLREAQTRLAGSEPLLPEMRGLGAPDEVYAGGSSRDGGVVLVYRAAGSGLPALGDTGVGLVLTEVPGSVEAVYLRGGALAAAGTEEVRVGNGRGYWLPSDHRPSSPADRGDLRGSVLFWERGGLALQLEADVSKHEAIHIAGSVR